MTALIGSWSQYATLQGVYYSTARSPSDQPTSFSVALYTNTANPDTGSPHEVTDSAYSQQSCDLSFDDTDFAFANDSDVVFGPFDNSVTLGGVAIVDDGSGEIMWFVDVSPTTTLPAGSGVLIGAGEFAITTIPG